LWIDPERKLALVLLTNRTWPDRANKAIQEVRPALLESLAEGMASRRRSCAPN
jgi:CubicO group peptidase (beta-lactamase class C family)